MKFNQKYGGDGAYIEHTIEMIFHGFIWNEFVNQHSLSTGNTIPNERHQMTMMDTTNDLDFCLKLSLSLPTARLEALNCYYCTIRQYTFMYIPKSSLTQ